MSREIPSFWDLRQLSREGRLDAFCEAVRAHPQVVLGRADGEWPTLLWYLFEDFGSQHRWGHAPLDEAGVVKAIAALLEVGEDPNNILPYHSEHQLPSGALAVVLRGQVLSNRHWASPDGAEAMVRALLEGGADPGQLDESGFSPLVSAAIWDDPRLFEVMVQAGAKVNPKRQDLPVRGRIRWPLFEARYRQDGDVKAMARLVEAGADVNAVGCVGGFDRTLLYVVCDDDLRSITDRLETIEWLVRTGADAAQYGPGGNTPLHGLCTRGARGGCVSIDENTGRRAVSLLLSAGADINALNENGDSALGLAVLKSDHGLANALIEAGADPNAGRPPLLWLYEGAKDWTRTGWAQRRPLRKALLDAGADINAIYPSHPFDGLNLLQMVCRNHGCPLRDLREILDLGADPTAGRTAPIDLYLHACYHDAVPARSAVLTLLLEYGSPAPSSAWWGKWPDLKRVLELAGLEGPGRPPTGDESATIRVC